MKIILLIAGFIMSINSFAMTAHPQNGTTILKAAEKYQGVITSCDLTKDDIESLETLASQSNSYDYCYQFKVKKQFFINEGKECINVERVFQPRRKVNGQIAVCS